MYNFADENSLYVAAKTYRIKKHPKVWVGSYHKLVQEQ